MTLPNWPLELDIGNTGNTGNISIHAPCRDPKIKRIVIKGVTTESHLLIRLIRSCMQRDSLDMHHCVADVFCRHPSACTSGRACGRFLISQSRHSSFCAESGQRVGNWRGKDRRGQSKEADLISTQRRSGAEECVEFSPWGQSPLELDALGGSRSIATQSGVGADATECVPPVLDTLPHEPFPQWLHQAFQTDAPWVV